MAQPVSNAPRTLTTAATSAATITVTTNAQLRQGYTVPNGGFTQLIVNDCTAVASATTGNAILTISASQLQQGMTIPTSATASGFTVSQVPSGVAISVSAGTQI